MLLQVCKPQLKQCVTKDDHLVDDKNSITHHPSLNADNLKNFSVLFSIIILVVFLFVGGGEHQKHRLINDVWDSGHIVLFSLLSFSYFRRATSARYSLTYIIVFTTIASLIIGVTVEVIQILFNRSFSVNDIFNDVIGGYLGILFLIIFSHHKTIYFRTSASLIFIFLLAMGLRGLGKNLYDEIVMSKQFPVLAGFESQLELERWDFYRVNVKRSQKFTKFGKYSLEIEYLRGGYPTVSMKYLRSDWSGYNNLNFSVYSTSNENQEFVLKVFDKIHIENGYIYADRFNENITLRNGWNTIDIPLSNIINAPGGRLMDIHEIRVFSFFADKLNQPVTIYIDDIHLL